MAARIRSGLVSTNGVLAARGDRERLGGLFSESPIPTVMVDGQRRYIEASQPAPDAFGLTLPEIRRLRIDDVTPPYLLPELEEAWTRLLDTGVVLGRESSRPRRTYVALSRPTD
jgi:PAS domain-containing protein